MDNSFINGITVDGYTDYDQMSDANRHKVDRLYESYRNGTLDGTSTEQVEYFIAKRLNKDVIRQINDKLDQEEHKRNCHNNAIRQQMFEDRVRNGYYGNRQDSSEVAALRKEVSEMKDAIGALTRLLNENLK